MLIGAAIPSISRLCRFYTVEDAERALELLRPVSYADEIELADALSCRFTRVGLSWARLLSASVLT